MTWQMLDEWIEPYLDMDSRFPFRSIGVDLDRLRYLTYGATPLVASSHIPLDIATNELTAEAPNESSEELDNFLKEFVLKEVR